MVGDLRHFQQSPLTHRLPPLPSSFPPMKAAQEEHTAPLLSRRSAVLAGALAARPKEDSGCLACSDPLCPSLLPTPGMSPADPPAREGVGYPGARTAGRLLGGVQARGPQIRPPRGANPTGTLARGCLWERGCLYSRRSREGGLETPVWPGGERLGGALGTESARGAVFGARRGRYRCCGARGAARARRAPCGTRTRRSRRRAGGRRGGERGRAAAPGAARIP